MGKKKQGGNLGRAIIKDRFGKHGGKGTKDTHLHTSELGDGFEWGRLNLQSVTDQSNLDDFLATAELAGTEFVAEKMNVMFVNPEKDSGVLSVEEQHRVKQTQDEHKAWLRIPRRPTWDESTTAEELALSERDSFLEWRRKLSQLQDVDGLILTPFEKNLEFWRQLWRVIERSDLVVQIVDARDPLLFYCEDLATYVKEISLGKENMILINKADHLSPRQRELWAEYFEKQGIQVAFWSAVLETERIKKQNAAEAEEMEVNKEDDSDSEEESESEESEEDDENEMEQSSPKETESVDNRLVAEEKVAESSEATTSSACENQPESNISITEDNNASIVNADHSDSGQNRIDSADNNDMKSLTAVNTVSNTSSSQDNNENRVLPESDESDTVNSSSSDSNTMASNVMETEHCNEGDAQSRQLKNNPDLVDGDELVELFKNLHTGEKFQTGVTTVGLVGYPNVGKSSTINAILQTKKVPVSATPGRTKHFQTLFVESDVMLCDCPGLVMPTFVSTKAEMIISGILPIDQMRDYVPPVALVSHQIPRQTLEAIYGIMLPPPEEGEDPRRPPTSHELLGVYACMRGYMTHKGIPDFQKAARHILKDYVNGKLLYSHCPPSVSEDVFHPAMLLHKTKAGILVEAVPDTEETTDEPLYKSKVDEAFFSKSGPSFGSKGIQGVVEFQRMDGYTGHRALDSNSDTTTVVSSQQSVAGKPWKKHNNRHKKEKLRRLNPHLDTF